VDDGNESSVKAIRFMVVVDVDVDVDLLRFEVIRKGSLIATGIVFDDSFDGQCRRP
jgi:hypothetical protein